MKFDRLVGELLAEAHVDPQDAQHIINRQRSELQSKRRVGSGGQRDVFGGRAWSDDLPMDPLGKIVVRWKGSDKLSYLKNPETKKVLVYKHSRARAKIEAMKQSGRYDQVFFEELPE